MPAPNPQLEAVVRAELPEVLEGHWSTAGGREMALRTIKEERSQLIKGALSDFELANAQFMVDRNSLDLIVWQTAAKERIRWLSAKLALAQAAIDTLSSTERERIVAWLRGEASDLRANGDDLLADTTGEYADAIEAGTHMDGQDRRGG